MSTTQPIRSTEKLELFKNYYKSVKPNARNYALIVTGLNSALRISDILHLTYGEVYDFSQKEWKTHIQIREQKTGKINTIYMNTEIRHVLAFFADCSHRHPTEWIFTSQMQSSQPLSRYQAFRIIKKAAFYAGLDSGISCHSLRKTFGYYAWKQGTPPALLMDIYNHSSFQVTKRYLGIEQDDRDAVFENIKI